MSGPWLYALTAGPLAFYLAVLALWQSDRKPKVVRGTVDFGLLAFGLGGILAFGPFGRLLARMISPRPDLVDWLVVLSVLGLGTMALGRRARRRLVVYHLDAEALAKALAGAVGRTSGRFVKTMGGYEDIAKPRGLRIESTRWLRCAVIEAYGVDAERLIEEFRPHLIERLDGLTSRPSPIAPALFAGAIAVALAPVVAIYLAEPHNRETLRVLLERLRGG